MGTAEDELLLDLPAGELAEEDPPLSESPVTHVRRGSEQPKLDEANSNQRLSELALLRGDRTLAEALRARKARGGS